MTICVNEKDPNSLNKKTKGGYSACCPKETCKALIGQEDYFKKEIGKPKSRTEIIKKYQKLLCYFCAENTPGKMIIWANPNPEDPQTEDGYSACCLKLSCQKQAKKEKNLKNKIGTLVKNEIIREF
jgi:hypothetical protein